MILDTHIWIWLVTMDKRLDQKTRKSIVRQMDVRPAKVSIISCWEVAKLVEKGKLAFSVPLDQWLYSALRFPGVELQELTPAICLDSCSLPGSFHGDPADQLIVATSRVLNRPLVTKDRKILDYRHVTTVD
jgi:PIN domain nuclease of toxin-antitoxin system